MDISGVIAVSLEGSRGCFVNISQVLYNRVGTRENGQGESFAVLSRDIVASHVAS